MHAWCAVAGRVHTFNGRALGQYGDGAHCYLLQVVDGTAFGAPAVRSNPQKMAHVIGPLSGIEDSPARTFGLDCMHV